MNIEAPTPPRVSTVDSFADRCVKHLYAEASVLDDGRITEWLSTVHPGIDYRVVGRTLVWEDGTGKWVEGAELVRDNYAVLEMRAQRMGLKTAWAENPRTLTRRIVGNIRVECLESAPEERNEIFLARSTVLLVRYLGDSQELMTCERTDTFLDDQAAGSLLLLSRKVVVDGEPVGLRNLSMIL
ncbi:MAG TPA: aromatic-ring-hydroxylating dioxygenase subunit beta [Thermoplasmata archaeon]|nr:aromatic-ring-hydroxylating dioxygenase subunit beta [Thermoplasmata archaeon]